MGWSGFSPAHGFSALFTAGTGAPAAEAPDSLPLLQGGNWESPPCRTAELCSAWFPGSSPPGRLTAAWADRVVVPARRALGASGRNCATAQPAGLNRPVAPTLNHTKEAPNCLHTRRRSRMDIYNPQSRKSLLLECSPVSLREEPIGAATFFGGEQPSGRRPTFRLRRSPVRRLPASRRTLQPCHESSG